MNANNTDSELLNTITKYLPFELRFAGAEIHKKLARVYVGINLLDETIENILLVILIVLTKGRWISNKFIQGIVWDRVVSTEAVLSERVLAFTKYQKNIAKRKIRKCL